MTARPRLAVLLAALAVAAGCPGKPDPVDSIPPAPAAHPGGGSYGAVQYVTLAAEEGATIHYALEGAPPPPGHPTTGAAENPVYWIRIGPGTTTLRFFAVDRAGNRSTTRSETYVIGVPPP